MDCGYEVETLELVAVLSLNETLVISGLAWTQDAYIPGRIQSSSWGACVRFPTPHLVQKKEAFGANVLRKLAT